MAAAEIQMQLLRISLPDIFTAYFHNYHKYHIANICLLYYAYYTPLHFLVFQLNSSSLHVFMKWRHSQSARYGISGYCDLGSLLNQQIRERIQIPLERM